MKKRLMMLALCSALAVPTTVSADILDYEGTINAYKQDNKTAQTFEIDNGSGEKVTAVAKTDIVSISVKSTYIRSNPGKDGKKLKKVYLGTSVERVAVCDNGWSKVTYEYKNKNGEQRVSGYVQTKNINDSDQVKAAKGTFTALKDSDILDYPGKKDGEVVGEIIQEDEVKRLSTVNDIWSQISYKNDEGKKKIGYIPTSVLENVTDTKESEEETKIAEVDGQEAGVIHKSEGKGVFADAVEGVTASKGESVNGVQIGTPVAVSSEATLKPLGTFKITHYCPCSICCGPWANGITASGVTATTNHTIAVDPSQIPYGSKVVINGQVYVAEAVQLSRIVSIFMLLLTRRVKIKACIIQMYICFRSRSQSDICNPLPVRGSTPNNCLLLSAIEAGDLLDSVKV